MRRSKKAPRSSAARCSSFRGDRLTGDGGRGVGAPDVTRRRPRCSARPRPCSEWLPNRPRGLKPCLSARPVIVEACPPCPAPAALHSVTSYQVRLVARRLAERTRAAPGGSRRRGGLSCPAPVHSVASRPPARESGCSTRTGAPRRHRTRDRAHAGLARVGDGGSPRAPKAGRRGHSGVEPPRASRVDGPEPDGRRAAPATCRSDGASA